MDSMRHYSTYQSQFIEMFGSESNKVLLEDVVFVKDDCRKPINEGVRSEMKEGELYPYYGATGVVDYINDYITDEELLCVAEDCGNYNAGEESAYIIRGKAWVNNHAHLVKMKDSCDIKYLYYYLKIANLMPYVSGTTRLKLTQKKLREIPVVLPTKDKQTTFVAIAEQADKSKFNSLKSQFIEMFSDVPKVGINTLVDTIWGSSPDSKTYNDTGEGVPFYQGKTEFGDLYINAPVTFCTAPVKMAKANAILMSVRAPVGAVNIATQDCCIGRGLASITPKEGKSTTMFIYYALKYMEEDIDRLGTGSTFKAINKESYAKIQMPNAEISDQTKFVYIAEQADKSKLV